VRALLVSGRTGAGESDVADVTASTNPWAILRQLAHITGEVTRYRERLRRVAPSAADWLATQAPAPPESANEV
jgi:hypothetical protein